MANLNPIQLQKDLKGVDYPASKDDLLAQAQKNNADQDIIDAIKQLKDSSFEKPTDVTSAIMGH